MEMHDSSGSGASNLRVPEYMRLADHLGRLLYLLHLGSGVEVTQDQGADRLPGVSVSQVPDIKTVDQGCHFTSQVFTGCL